MIMRSDAWYFLVVAYFLSPRGKRHKAWRLSSIQYASLKTLRSGVRPFAQPHLISKRNLRGNILLPKMERNVEFDCGRKFERLNDSQSAKSMNYGKSYLFYRHCCLTCHFALNSLLLKLSYVRNGIHQPLPTDLYHFRHPKLSSGQNH